MYIQYSLTNYGCWEYYRSHLSIFLFPFSFDLERGTPHPTQYFGSQTLSRGLPIACNFVVKNVYCQYVYPIGP